MRGPSYRYNALTCRYERSGISWIRIILKSFLVLITSSLILAGLLMLHNDFNDSEKERSLRKENTALSQSEVILTKQLSEIELTLDAIKEKDKALHTKFFSSVSTVEETANGTYTSQHILLADASGLQTYLNDVKEKSRTYINMAASTNLHYSEQLQIRYYLDVVHSFPVGKPVADLTAEMLLSGFGMRINPFHKALYRHEGIDIVVPRGTEVMSTAAGKVTNVKFNSIEAGFGNYIEIDHGNGFISRYAHMEDIVVRLGAEIQKGAVIGTSGNTGGSVAPHLHYEVLRNGKNVDPIDYLIEGIGSAEHGQFRISSKRQNQSLD
jgi:murein DD-endopeptidase MepM/ murein hydrolase activator NlpD